MLVEIPDGFLSQNLMMKRLVLLVSTGIFAWVYLVDRGIELNLPPRSSVRIIKLLLGINGSMKWLQQSPTSFGCNYISFEKVLELVDPEIRTRLLFHLDLFAPSEEK